MNKNIVKGTRVSGEKYSKDYERVVKVIGKYFGLTVGGEAIIEVGGLAGTEYVVPSSLRKLVKKKKPETFTTSKGFVFTKTERGWIDEASKLEWMNEFTTRLNHYNAEKWAQGQGMCLATREEFIEAESHGIRELPGMVWKGYWFCSSTRYPGYNGRVACEFNGDDGYVYYVDSRGDSFSYVATRAVRKV